MQLPAAAGWSIGPRPRSGMLNGRPVGRNQQSLRHYYDTLPLLPSSAPANLGYLGMNLFGQSMPLVHESHYRSEQTIIQNDEIINSTFENIEKITKKYNVDIHVIYKIFSDTTWSHISGIKKN